MNPTILPFRGIMPVIHPTAYIAPGAVVMGDVTVGAHSSVWPGCVLRGDVNVVRIGDRANIQDGTVVHVTYGGQGTHIGSDVTVGHCALLHDCTLEDFAFVGMKACILDRARVQGRGMLAAGALLTSGKTVRSGELWAGSPAKLWRALSEADIAEIEKRPGHYVRLAAAWQGGEWKAASAPP